MAGLSIAAASSQAWSEMGAQAERAFNTGWILDQSVTSTGGFATLAAPSTLTAFLSSGDGTTGSGNGFWALGRLARVVHTGGTAYAAVQSAVYGAPVTTVGLGDFQSGGTTSLSTTAVTSAAAAVNFNGPTGNEYTKVRVINRVNATVVASTASVTADSTFYTYTVPGNILGTSGILRLTALGDWQSSAATLAGYFKVLYGATTVITGSSTLSSVSASTSIRYWAAQVELQNIGATNVQKVFGCITLGPPLSSFSMDNTLTPGVATQYGVAAENSSTNLALSLQFRATSTNSGVSINLRHAFLELIQ